MEGIEYADRYTDLNISRPDPRTMCTAQCEGTGFIPVHYSDPDPTFKHLWLAQESIKKSSDGYHFVECPECQGTGKKRVRNITMNQESQNESLSVRDSLIHYRQVLENPDKVPGGEGDDEPDSKFDPKQLMIGIGQEGPEHTNDIEIAKEIAKDHLEKDPEYYTHHKDTDETLDMVKCNLCDNVVSESKAYSSGWMYHHGVGWACGSCDPFLTHNKSHLIKESLSPVSGFDPDELAILESSGINIHTLTEKGYLKAIGKGASVGAGIGAGLAAHSTNKDIAYSEPNNRYLKTKHARHIGSNIVTGAAIGAVAGGISHAMKQRRANKAAKSLPTVVTHEDRINEKGFFKSVYRGTKKGAWRGGVAGTVGGGLIGHTAGDNPAYSPSSRKDLSKLGGTVGVISGGTAGAALGGALGGAYAAAAHPYRRHKNTSHTAHLQRIKSYWQTVVRHNPDAPYDSRAKWEMHIKKIDDMLQHLKDNPASYYKKSHLNKFTSMTPDDVTSHYKLSNESLRSSIRFILDEAGYLKAMGKGALIGAGVGASILGAASAAGATSRSDIGPFAKQGAVIGGIAGGLYGAASGAILHHNIRKEWHGQDQLLKHTIDYWENIIKNNPDAPSEKKAKWNAHLQMLRDAHDFTRRSPTNLHHPAALMSVASMRPHDVESINYNESFLSNTFKEFGYDPNLITEAYDDAGSPVYPHTDGYPMGLYNQPNTPDGLPYTDYNLPMIDVGIPLSPLPSGVNDITYNQRDALSQDTRSDHDHDLATRSQSDISAMYPAYVLYGSAMDSIFELCAMSEHIGPIDTVGLMDLAHRLGAASNRAATGDDGGYKPSASDISIAQSVKDAVANAPDISMRKLATLEADKLLKALAMLQ